MYRNTAKKQTVMYMYPVCNVTNTGSTRFDMHQNNLNSLQILSSLLKLN